MLQCLDVPEALVQFAAGSGEKHMSFLLYALFDYYQKNSVAEGEKWRDDSRNIPASSA